MEGSNRPYCWRQLTMRAPSHASAMTLATAVLAGGASMSRAVSEAVGLREQARSAGRRGMIRPILLGTMLARKF
jgi:hypothetical protein